MPRQTESQKQRKAAETQATTRKQATARANGSKSTGPKSQAGRDRISQINTRHGMKARRLNPLLVPNEDVNKLNEITLAYYQHIRPGNAAEASLVDLLIASIWRGARLITYEAELLTDKAEDLQSTLAETYESISSDRLFALAFEALNGKGSANPTINRYLATTRNSYHSAISDIERLRKIKGDPEQPYYEPKLAAEIPAIVIEFPKPEPEPEPQPEPEPETLAEPEHEVPSPSTAGGPPVTPARTALDDLLAKAVPNPDAPPSPNTIWIPMTGPDGNEILDVKERPILKPIHIGPAIPALPTEPAINANSTASTKSQVQETPTRDAATPTDPPAPLATPESPTPAEPPQLGLDWLLRTFPKPDQSGLRTGR
jgi:hypothetical protein